MNIKIKPVVELILKIQKKSGEIPWNFNGKTDPWDHVESAMALTIGGCIDESQKAFKWLKNLQMDDGSWYSSYKNGIPFDKTIETSMSAYIAVGVFHYWLVTMDFKFLNYMWDCIYKAINFVINYQGSNGEIYWAINSIGKVDKKALLTASSSVFMSLKCGLAIAKELYIDVPHWKIALGRLKNAILYKSFLFDSSKNRFSMDWFYPILSGILSRNLAYNRINKYWNTFVVDGLGVRCVSDKPWITIAESSELILSLAAINSKKIALSILNWISVRVFDDGSYWCGFTFPNNVLWPEEKISWNNAVFVIAVDSIYGLTPASVIFDHSLWLKRYRF